MNIVVIRFSALGDVALSSPVIYSILKNNPEVKIWYVSKKNHINLFEKHDRFQFISSDLNGAHKGILGLKKLVSEILKTTSVDVVVDIHNVLRSKIMCALFRLHGKKIITFEKGRIEKKRLIAGKIPFQPIAHVTKKYLNAFSSIIDNVDLEMGPWVNPKPKTLLKLDPNKIAIGIAPFAAHKSKEWGIKKINDLITKLPDYEIILLGGGVNEIADLNKIEKKYSNCNSIAGKYNLNDQLYIISNLKAIISMDSANMHLAALVGTPVVSIWGPTHYFMGFSPLNNLDNIVEVSREILPCRPCSVYGKINTKKQENCAFLSMDKISVEQVINKLSEVISKK